MQIGERSHRWHFPLCKAFRSWVDAPPRVREFVARKAPRFIGRQQSGAPKREAGLWDAAASNPAPIFNDPGLQTAGHYANTESSDLAVVSYVSPRGRVQIVDTAFSKTDRRHISTNSFGVNVATMSPPSAETVGNSRKHPATIHTLKQRVKAIRCERAKYAETQAFSLGD
jgi:hypothetical protein